MEPEEIMDFMLIYYGAELMPVRKHPEDAGMDCFAPTTFKVAPGQCVDVPLGFGTVLPKGYAAYIKPRGSFGKLGLLPIDNPIDSNYRGEIHAVCWNLSSEYITVGAGVRFCQLVVAPCVLDNSAPLVFSNNNWRVIKPEEAPDSDRGAGSYGSTGK